MLVWQTQNIQVEVEGAAAAPSAVWATMARQEAREKQRAADKNAERIREKNYWSPAADSASLAEWLCCPAPPKFGVSPHRHRCICKLWLLWCNIVIILISMVRLFCQLLFPEVKKDKTKRNKWICDSVTTVPTPSAEEDNQSLSNQSICVLFFKIIYDFLQKLQKKCAPKKVLHVAYKCTL